MFGKLFPYSSRSWFRGLFQVIAKLSPWLFYLKVQISWLFSYSTEHSIQNSDILHLLLCLFMYHHLLQLNISFMKTVSFVSLKKWFFLSRLGSMVIMGIKIRPSKTSWLALIKSISFSICLIHTFQFTLLSGMTLWCIWKQAGLTRYPRAWLVKLPLHWGAIILVHLHCPSSVH